jgi:broad specificity phosphatase PhoE
MNRREILVAAVFTAALAASGVSAFAAPTIYVMRHLDTPQGERDPDLTAAGHRNAATLVRWFAGKPLAAIYISDFKRTRQTVAPLAVRRGLTPKRYDPADTAGLVRRVRGERGPILIVGHSNTVPDIVAQLGGPRPAPLSHPDFGDIWTIAPGGTVRGMLRD